MPQQARYFLTCFIQKWFEEEEIWSMLTDLINSLRNFAQRNLVHGDVQSCNIFVLSDNKFKIIDSAFLNEFESGYIRRKNDMDYFSPLSPKALISLMNRDKTENYDKLKNDIYAAGMTILSTVFNEDYNKYYDWPNHIVRYDIVKERLVRLLNMGYSKQLVAILSRMLESDENMRVPLNELYNSCERGKSSQNYEPILRGSVNPYSKQNQAQSHQQDFHHKQKRPAS